LLAARLILLYFIWVHFIFARRLISFVAISNFLRRFLSPAPFSFTFFKFFYYFDLFMLSFPPTPVSSLCSNFLLAFFTFFYYFDLFMLLRYVQTFCLLSSISLCSLYSTQHLHIITHFQDSPHLPFSNRSSYDPITGSGEGGAISAFEAPAMFKRNDIYYALTSAPCCYCGQVRARPTARAHT
jgi:hypothetical protein